MAARVVGIRQEGVNPCRMVPSMRDVLNAMLLLKTIVDQMAVLNNGVSEYPCGPGAVLGEAL